jgi:hypothetical protein
LIAERWRDLYSKTNDPQGACIDAGNYRSTAELRMLIEEFSAAQQELERIRKENDYLRGVVAYSGLPCIHCGLEKDDMHRCQHGFPGCARADDMLCADIRHQSEESN